MQIGSGKKSSMWSDMQKWRARRAAFADNATAVSNALSGNLVSTLTALGDGKAQLVVQRVIDARAAALDKKISGLKSGSGVTV